MNFKSWEEVFRSLRECAAAGEVRGYRFGSFTVLDPESFKVATSKSILRFSELEAVLGRTFSNRVKSVIRKIFSKKDFSKIDSLYLLNVEMFCKAQAEAAEMLPKEILLGLVKDKTGLSTEESIKIYLENILNSTKIENPLLECSTM